MSRNKNNMASKFFIMLACVSLLSLGACASSAPTPDATNADADEQAAARDGGYAENSALVDINFDFDRSEIRPDQRERLDTNAQWIQNNAGSKVQVEGHCDSRGTEEYNLALGERRANTIRDYLISYGVDATRLYTISYGEELPLDPGTGEAAWGANRRAHFLVTQ